MRKHTPLGTLSSRRTMAYLTSAPTAAKTATAPFWIGLSGMWVG